MVSGVFALLLQASTLPAVVDPVLRPDWTSKPTAEDVGRAFPASALKDGLSGLATITCIVTAEGALTGCEASVQQPEGQGFGEAAIKLSRRFRLRALDADGRPTVGRPIRIPIRWLQESSSSAGPIKLKSSQFRGTVEADCRYVGAQIDNCLMLRVEPYSPELSAAVSTYAERMAMPKISSPRGRIRLLFEVGP